jgi:hypothetical protein
VREFGSWFFRRKSELLAWEIERSGLHPALFGCFWIEPTMYADCAWARQQFHDRLLGASVRSGIRSLSRR